MVLGRPEADVNSVELATCGFIGCEENIVLRGFTSTCAIYLNCADPCRLGGQAQILLCCLAKSSSAQAHKYEKLEML